MKLCTFMLVVMVAMATVTMTSSSKILLVPAAHYSHVNFFAVAAKTLKDNGHDVTIVVHDKHSKRVTKANVTSWVYPLSPDADVSNIAGNIISESADSDANIITTAYNGLKRSVSSVDNFCREVLGNEDLMQKIKNGHFDLAILDSFPIMSCIYFIPYKYNIRYMSLGPFIFPWQNGVSSIPFHEISLTTPIRSSKPTLFHRVVSTLMAIPFETAFYVVDSQGLAADFLPEKPYQSTKQLVAKTEMTLITMEIHCFDFPRVSAPHYRFIGSLSGSVSVEPLPEDFKKFADDSKEGLIVISFGSMTSLRKSIARPIRMLIEALGRMKERAILQFTLEDLSDVKIPDNVIVKGWLPQTDLLGHPNTKLFIAHGGLNGQLEATYLGVPILTIPFQPEQERHGARAEAKGHGKLLKWDETNALEIYETMREIIDDESYKQNIQKCAAILKDVPGAREQLVFWVNHVIKHGTEHLRPLAADMPFYQFFGLDVFAVFLTVSLFFGWLMCACCRCCCRRCCRSASKQKRKKK